MSQIVYQLHISLSGSNPPVWRRIQVLGSTHLGDLHDILQAVMGWKNENFYQFIIHDRCYGDGDLGSGDARSDAESVTLGSLVKRPKIQFLYEYDFNDGWEHEILVEKIRPVPDTEAAAFPLVIEGESACPPEDCGGILGYFEILEALRDPEHPAYEELRRQYGDFDPEKFDLESANAAVHALYYDEPIEASTQA